MSTAVRTDLATAASTVAGVNVTPFYRQSLKAGDGFVRLGPTRKGSNGFGYVTTYEVWLAVPNDPEPGERWLEDNLPAVLAALDPVMAVSAATPAEMALGSTILNGVIIAGTV